MQLLYKWMSDGWKWLWNCKDRRDYYHFCVSAAGFVCLLLSYSVPTLFKYSFWSKFKMTVGWIENNPHGRTIKQKKLKIKTVLWFLTSSILIYIEGKLQAAVSLLFRLLCSFCLGSTALYSFSIYICLPQLQKATGLYLRKAFSDDFFSVWYVLYHTSILVSRLLKVAPVCCV